MNFDFEEETNRFCSCAHTRKGRRKNEAARKAVVSDCPPGLCLFGLKFFKLSVFFVSHVNMHAIL